MLTLNYFNKWNTLRFDDIAENMNNFLDKCEVLFDKYKIKPVLGKQYQQ